MQLNNEVIMALSKRLGKEEVAEVLRLSAETAKMENLWKRRVQERLDLITGQIIGDLEKTGKVNPDAYNFEEFFFFMIAAVYKKGFTDAVEAKPEATKVSLAKNETKKKIQKQWDDYREVWEEYRKTKKVPKRIAQIANRYKEAYVKKCQSIWSQASEDFRKGEIVSKSEVVEKVREGARATYSRANTIVETETTRYYNEARRRVYDASEDVTHYLFLSVRDRATTAWCKSRTGLVYKKGDPLLDSEQPPIHWNCRSEILPLTPLNPRHKLLIEDKSIARRSHKCEPLPKGWNK